MESLDIILERSEIKYSQDEKNALAEKKNNAYRELLAEMTESDIPDETRKTLADLRAAGLKLAIGSSSKNTKFILSRVELLDAFDAISDGTNIQRSKPDPQVFLMAADMIGLKPEECLVVEDAYAGIDAACAGGFKSAGIGDASSYEKTTYPIKVLAELCGICQ